MYCRMYILPQGSGAEAANYCIHYSIENKVSSVIRRGSRGGYLELRVKYSEGVGRRGSYIPGGLGGVYREGGALLISSSCYRHAQHALQYSCCGADMIYSRQPYIDIDNRGHISTV